jgi:MFS family permease
MTLPNISMTKTQGTWVLVAALATLLVSILDTNIVTSVAVPIAQSLQPDDGAAAVPWLLAVYALAGTVVQPIYGKLADTIGVRAVFLTAVGVFVAGSVLCGFATTMPELIVFRGIQGLGGGGLMSVTMVVIGHLRAEAESHGEQQSNSGNAVAAVLVGAGLVAGPLVGGFIEHLLGWRWIFLINVPLGLTALVIMAVALKLPLGADRGTIDPVSALCLGVGAASLLVVCQWGGRQFAWTSWQISAAAIVCIGSISLFAWRQKTGRNPFFPPRLLSEPTLRIVTFLQLASGLGMAAGIVYLTLDLQLVHGLSPVQTGVQLMPIAVGLGIGAWLGTLVTRKARSLRGSIALGAAGTAAALGGFAACGADTPLIVVSAIMVVFGAGLGLGLGNELLVIFAVVDRRDLGVATTGIRFVETLGTSLGATAFATLFAAIATASSDAATQAGAIEIIFLIGMVFMAAASGIALRLPHPASHQPE